MLSEALSTTPTAFAELCRRPRIGNHAIARLRSQLVLVTGANESTANCGAIVLDRCGVGAL
jgi:hypothetical protein